jgi:urease accessory protein UreE
MMIKIREISVRKNPALDRSIPLNVDRRVLAKRRWRGRATDGTDFGFDLAVPLKHGACFYSEDERYYLIDQKPEKVFRVSFPNQQEAAHLAWQVGNLHFPAQFKEDYLLVEGDLAVQYMLERNEIPFEESVEIFQPILAVSSHHHGPGKLSKYLNIWQ